MLIVKNLNLISVRSWAYLNDFYANYVLFNGFTMFLKDFKTCEKCYRQFCSKEVLTRHS